MKIFLPQITRLCVIALCFSAQAVFAAEDTSVSAQAALSPTKGSSVTGVVSFTPVKDGVKIVADITGLAPGEHGFHIHEFGDCSAPDAASAGGHFNPEHKAHGAPDAPEHHVGDLGNVTADASGKVHYELIDKKLAFTGKDSILGRGVIVHANPDDLHSQPVGNAGGRVACGIVGVVKQ